MTAAHRGDDVMVAMEMVHTEGARGCGGEETSRRCSEVAVVRRQSKCGRLCRNKRHLEHSSGRLIENSFAGSPSPSIKLKPRQPLGDRERGSKAERGRAEASWPRVSRRGSDSQAETAAISGNSEASWLDGWSYKR